MLKTLVIYSDVLQNLVKIFIRMRVFCFLAIKEPFSFENLPVINIWYPKGKYPKITGRVPHSISLSCFLDVTDVLMATRAFRPVSCWRIDLGSREGMLDSGGTTGFSTYLYQLSITLPMKNISNIME